MYNLLIYIGKTIHTQYIIETFNRWKNNYTKLKLIFQIKLCILILKIQIVHIVPEYNVIFFRYPFTPKFFVF